MGKHGYWKHPLYTVWRGMIGRCSHQSNPYYDNYGGRNIRVCAEWMNAKAFIEWALSAGWQLGLQIDRIDNDGDYCPSNCRFVTRKVNCRNARHNRLIVLHGVTKTLAEWSEELRVSNVTIRGRLRRGWTPEQALTLPLRRGRKP